MIWVTSRQARLEALIIGALLVLLAGIFFFTGREMANAFETAGLHDCVVSHAGTDSCWSSASAFLDRFQGLTSLASWLNFLPLLLGLLLASPAVADLEQGTYRLVWTQSISRGRWLLAKIAFGGVGAAAISGGLVLLWSWWRGPFDALQGRFDGNAFDFEGTVPIAYAVFAFALCLAIGTMLRRIVPAAGISIVAFLGVRLFVENRLRPHYQAPVRITWDALAAAPQAALTKFGAGDWIISQGNVDAAGHAVAGNDPVWRSCLGPPPPGGGDKIAIGGKDVVNSCLHDHGILNAIVYQPAHRFWLFQGIETGIFLFLALALFALTAWWVRRRIV
jgi:hypothetical protein